MTNRNRQNLAKQFQTRLEGNYAIASTAAINAVAGQVHCSTVHQSTIDKIIEVAKAFPQVQKFSAYPEGVVVTF